MLAAFLLAIVLPNAPAGPRPANEIVVRGKSLQALRAELDSCIASHCPVREDVVASVRVGEALFRLGSYQDARLLLQRAIDRDRGRGAEDPLAVAALYEATSTVARHDGEQREVLAADGARMRLLQSTLGQDAPDTLRAKLDYADSSYVLAPFAGASMPYRRLVDEAEAANQPAIAALARLRLANIAMNSGERDAAIKQLDQVTSGPANLPSGIRLAALALRIKLSRGGAARTAAVDAYRAALGRTVQPNPVLLSSPPPPIADDIVDLTYFDQVDRHTQGEDHYGARWADVSFAIRPDGHVEAPEMLRGTLDTADVAAISKAIAGRVYAAFSAKEGNRYRVERWTLTADYATPTGSLIRRRLRNPHFVSLDITTGDHPPAQSGAS